MHKTLFLSFLIACSTMSMAQTDRKVSSFETHTIKENARWTTPEGVSVNVPDVYYEDLGNGAFKAHRLTVQPNALKSMTEPSLQTVTPNSVTIAWKTSSNPSVHRVLWGTTPDEQPNIVNSKIDALSDSYYWHTATITDLQPNTTYYYKVRSGKNTDLYEFRTLPEAGEQGKMRVLIIGDHQRNEVSDYEWLLHHAERRCNAKYGNAPLHQQVQFLMNMGDQVDAGQLTNYEQNHLYKNREVISQLPIMTTVGNHELNGDADVRLYEQHYASYKTLAYKGIASNTAKWYAYQTGRLLWVVMDSDHCTAEQKMWVRRITAAADQDTTVDAIISVQHRPLYAEMYCNDVSPWARDEIMPILGSSSKHVLNCSGHHHLYARGQMTEYPLYHIISGGGVGTYANSYEQLFGVCLVDNADREEVQKTVDQSTYQILEYDSQTKTLSVETYAIGNRRLAIDGELVDSFSRCLTDHSAPAAPQLQLQASVLSQTAQADGLLSARYQVARDEAFTDIVEDHVVNFEDWYWVEDDFRPKDQMKGKTITRFDLATTALKSGNYYARVSNRSMNLNWGEWSDVLPISYSASPTSDPSLSVDGEYFTPNQSITVHIGNANKLASDAWVGVYAEGKIPGSNDTSYAWDYVNGRSQLTFQLKDANGYFVTLFKDGGYTEISERVHILVLPSREKAFNMTTDKILYKKGDPILVNIEGAPCLNKDWVGLYPEGWDPVNSKCPTYVYIGSQPDCQVRLNVSGTNNYTAPISDGTYFVSYFLSDGYAEPYNRQYFIVGQPVQLVALYDSFDEGQSVTILYEGAPKIMLDKNMSLCVQKGDSVVWQAPISKTGGLVNVPPLESGTYTATVVLPTGEVLSTPLNIVVNASTSIVLPEKEQRITGVYDLQGRRVGETLKDVQRGLYIFEGKKVKR